ncbi:hypothetical protein FOZ63_013615 [Perkinsus olseni]|uniref:Uncharacterized protein n=1 Tax=Perkinsus olseni TaxID=32597 RepID=A0A7J6SN85_PEROL|nr:hypothetical protein FOZ63_013615 [Perkinsus olseni]
MGLCTMFTMYHILTAGNLCVGYQQRIAGLEEENRYLKKRLVDATLPARGVSLEQKAASYNDAAKPDVSDDVVSLLKGDVNVNFNGSSDFVSLLEGDTNVINTSGANEDKGANRWELQNDLRDKLVDFQV